MWAAHVLPLLRSGSTRRPLKAPLPRPPAWVGVHSELGVLRDHRVARGRGAQCHLSPLEGLSPRHPWGAQGRPCAIRTQLPACQPAWDRPFLPAGWSCLLPGSSGSRLPCRGAPSTHPPRPRQPPRAKGPARPMRAFQDPLPSWCDSRGCAQLCRSRRSSSRPSPFIPADAEGAQESSQDEFMEEYRV